jgi:DedD protein
MADNALSQEERDLRRRARRRLVGAVALALVAVVVLPMVFDPEPRPLGDTVEIRIPEQTEPLVPMRQPVATPAATEPISDPVPVDELPVDAASGLVAPLPAKPEVKAAMPSAQSIPPEKKSDTKPATTETKPVVAAKPVVTPKADDKPAAKPVVVTKPESRPVIEAKKTETKPESPKRVADKPVVSGEYFLQLGVFSSSTNAELQVAKAKAAGFKSSVLPSGGKFRVRVGPIGDRVKALDYQTKLKSKGLDSVLVEP